MATDKKGINESRVTKLQIGKDERTHNKRAGTAKEDASKALWGYCRVSTARQDLHRQKLEIHEYANRLRRPVDRIVATKVSSRRKEKERMVTVLKEAAAAGEVEDIVFSEMSRLGRNVGELCQLIDYFVDQCNVTLHFVKESLVLTHGQRDITSKVMQSIFSLLAEIQRDLISEQVKSGLAARKALGVKLGRPMGKSKLDTKEEEIRNLIRMGCTQKAIAKRIECSPCLLSFRGLKCATFSRIKVHHPGRC